MGKNNFEKINFCETNSINEEQRKAVEKIKKLIIENNHFKIDINGKFSMPPKIQVVIDKVEKKYGQEDGEKIFKIAKRNAIEAAAKENCGQLPDGAEEYYLDILAEEIAECVSSKDQLYTELKEKGKELKNMGLEIEYDKLGEKAKEKVEFRLAA